MLQFKVLAKNKALTSQYELPVSGGQITWAKNSVNVANLTVDLKYLQDYLVLQSTTAKNLFESGWLNIYIYYGTTLIFAGYLSDITYAQSEQGGSISLTVKSWLGYFENRFYTATIAGTDAGTIAWNAINSANDIGITSGSITTPKRRDRTYRYDDIAKIVQGLSADNLASGYDFGITDAKVFNVYSAIGASKPYVKFDDFNVISYNLQVGLVGSVFNRGIILGAGDGDLQLVQTYSAGVSPYENNWYIQQLLLTDTTILETTTLLDKITQAITNSKDPLRTLTLQASAETFLDYVVGDTVSINLPKAELATTRRITKKALTFGDNNVVDLEFAI